MLGALSLFRSAAARAHVAPGAVPIRATATVAKMVATTKPKAAVAFVPAAAAMPLAGSGSGSSPLVDVQHGVNSAIAAVSPGTPPATTAPSNRSVLSRMMRACLPASAAAALFGSSISVASAAETASAAANVAVATGLSPFATKILSVMPPFFFFFLQTSPLKTIWQISANRSTGNLSPLPFVSLATNCVVWTLYGVLTQDATVFFPNASGLLFGLYYTYIYSKYSTGSVAPYLIGGAAIGGSMLVLAATSSAAVAAPIIGKVGCTAAVVLMASPLAVMGQVIRTKNSAAMPLVISAATWLNSLSWASYGYLVANDFLIYFPNILGFTAATIQLGLIAAYPPVAAAPSPADRPADPETGVN